MKKGLIFISSLLIVLTLTMVLGSCGGTDVLLPDSELHAIAFASEEADEEVMTRASAPLNRDFTVYGYKKVSGNAHVVFDGYSVTYNSGSAGTSVDNTHNYSYVNGSTQTIKYWDFGASEYNFWGYTGDKRHFSSANVLTVSGIVQSVTEPDVTESMFSAVYHRATVSTDVVRLQFLRPYVKVRILFYSGEELDDGDEVEISGITFSPASPKKIVTKGDLTITYPLSGEERESYSTSETKEDGDYLSFENVSLTHTAGTSTDNALTAKPTGGTDFYYAVPYNYGVSFTLSASVDDELKTAVVPAVYMNWKPNYLYTYIFKITETGKKIEFYDVKIDPWKYGGSQNEEWKNW